MMTGHPPFIKTQLISKAWFLCATPLRLKDELVIEKISGDKDLVALDIRNNVFADDFLRLRPREKLNNHVISWFLSHIMKRTVATDHQHKHPRLFGFLEENCMKLSPSVGKACTEEDFLVKVYEVFKQSGEALKDCGILQILQKLQNGKALQFYQRIVVVINHNNNHWISVMLDKEDEKIYIHDAGFLKITSSPGGLTLHGNRYKNAFHTIDPDLGIDKYKVCLLMVCFRYQIFTVY